MMSTLIASMFVLGAVSATGVSMRCSRYALRFEHWHDPGNITCTIVAFVARIVYLVCVVGWFFMITS